ncbi:protein KTI12 [Mytilus galloprovincialis]|uniref:Protein KTI12 homolog n=1 Tax=Mytilus galloprovincialis TaxID=29158 RepID=A0A8B6GLE5_MYTGA|nr:protein KTI12 [Mytilus galloprovincialis]
MPFVLICGFPSSGKSTRAQQLKEHFKAKTVNVISDHSIGVDRNSVYADSKKEKEIRGTLKSSVQRLLNTDDIVILDSLNYIKGYRYELYCITKSCKTPHCVLLCDISKDKAKEWNSLRTEEDKYSDEILEALFMRFEEPNPNQRWDSPLFVIQADDTLPFQQIEDALFNRKPPPPNMATQNQPLSSTNFLYELDRITQETNSVSYNGKPKDRCTRGLHINTRNSGKNTNDPCLYIGRVTKTQKTVYNLYKDASS